MTSEFTIVAVFMAGCFLGGMLFRLGARIIEDMWPPSRPIVRNTLIGLTEVEANGRRYRHDVLSSLDDQFDETEGYEA